MKRGDLCENARSGCGEPNKYPAPILDRVFPPDEVKPLEFINETDGAVMLDLKALAQVTDGQPVGMSPGLYRQERFVLFRGQVRFDGQGALAEIKEFPHRVAKISQRFVVVREQSGCRHSGTMRGTSFFCKAKK